MTWYWIRFIGDPTGYRRSWPDDSLVNAGWVWAYIGVTAEKVLVNMAQAYFAQPIGTPDPGWEM